MSLENLRRNLRRERGVVIAIVMWYVVLDVAIGALIDLERYPLSALLFPVVGGAGSVVIIKVIRVVEWWDRTLETDPEYRSERVDE